MTDKKKPLRIAFVSYSLVGGGVERRIINLAHFLRKKGCVVDIILFKNIIDYKKESAALNPIFLLNTNNKIPFLLTPLRALQIFIRLLITIKKNRYNILVGCPEFHPYYIVVLFARLLNIKSCLVINNCLLKELTTKSFISRIFHRILLKISLTMTNKIICVSKGLVFEIQNYFNIKKDKIQPIHNGIDIKAVQLNASERLANKIKYFAQRYKLIITAGRLVEQKGHFYLLRSFLYVKQLCPNTKLLILGKGHLEAYLLNFIKRLELENDIILLGFRENPFPYFKNADCFILPSIYEPFGNVIVEAMACGLSVIATDCFYGPREILSGNEVVYPYKPVKKITYCKYGILIPPFENSKENVSEEKVLAKAMLALLTNKKLRDHYKKMSLLRAKDFSLEKMGESYYEVLRNLLIE
jgi:glycosyltransferase involved in cell wall biosynthesis